MSLFGKVTDYLRMIKFSHSVFALPFAFTSALIAGQGHLTFHQVLWISIAMVSARTGAMGFNRIADRTLDALNPRTKGREIPEGKVTVLNALFLSFFSFGFFIYSAYMLNPLCLKLSPIAIAVVIFYSYTKRFTWLSHIVLGLSISSAPIGAWIAVRGEFSLVALPLGLAVLFWISGFDVLYAIQDIDFDRKHGLYSIPKRFGIKTSLTCARVFHLFSWDFLFLTGIIFSLKVFYWLGVFIAGGLFIYEHSLIKANDLSKLNVAFFNMNGYISLTVFVFTLLSYL
ncbi:MAG: UbiA family prenyltransferase [Nitrospirae bacterium]|nr:UbiA family prenyltransferase [Nitrospirota bacterium]